MDIIKETHPYARLPRDIKLDISFIDTNILLLCCPIYWVNPVRSFQICDKSRT